MLTSRFCGIVALVLEEKGDPLGLAGGAGLEFFLNFERFSSRCSSLVRPSRARKRTDTRSRTVSVCPFKTSIGETVSFPRKTARQPGRSALIAQRDGYHARVCGAGDRLRIVLVE